MPESVLVFPKSFWVPFEILIQPTTPSSMVSRIGTDVLGAPT